MTTNKSYADYPGNVFIRKEESGLPKDSVALIHQMIVVDNERLFERISKINKDILKKIEDAEDYVLKA